MEAYDYFLRGRELWHRLTKETNIAARDLLQRAIELDPNFAPAHAFLALTHGLDYLNRWSPSPPTSREQAEEVATRAVALDDRDPWAHWALGLVNLYLRRHDGAISEAQRAIVLNPNFAEGHVSLGEALHYSGRSDEALKCFDRAKVLNPYFPDVLLHFQALASFQLGRYEEAVGLLKQRLTRNPVTDVSRALLAASYGHLGRFDEARAAWQEVFASIPTTPWNTVAKSCPTRTPTISSLSWTGFARPAWYNDRWAMSGLEPAAAACTEDEQWPLLALLARSAQRDGREKLTCH